MRITLAVNAGSSSVKVSVYETERKEVPRPIAEVQVSGLTAPPAKLKYQRGGDVIINGKELQEGAQSQDDAFKTILETLIEDSQLPQIQQKSDVGVACHRIVHGGDYSSSQRITPDTYRHLEALSDLAPLHNGPALNIVKSCMELLPKALNIACFDSQFHSTIPEHIRTYPIDQQVARKNGLRKYGFHGISYSFITRSVAAFLGKQPDDVNLIALHLGSGASACAIKSGRSWDTSMGLTPLAGLPGATRSGSVDPSLVFHYASDVGKLSPSSTSDLHISRAEEILNKQSGWKALTGTTDFGIIAGSDQPEHRLAFDIFVDRVCGFVGSYYVSLGGQVDALVFAGGIGEKGQGLRKRVTEQVACLGFEIDEDRNGEKIERVVQDIGNPKARHRTLVCQTDEQLEMARDCAEDPSLW